VRSSTSSSEANTSHGAQRRHLYWLVALIVLLTLPSVLLGWNKPGALESIAVPKLQWIEHTLQHRGPSIQTVAVGSSKIWSGWLAEEVSQAHHGSPNRAANFGSQLRGRDRDYVLARETLERSGARRLVLEVGHAETEGHHPMFPRLATVGELAADLPLSLSVATTPQEAREQLSNASGDLQSGIYYGYANGLRQLLFPPARLGQSELAELGARGGSRHSTRMMETLPRARSTSRDRPNPGSRSLAYIDRIAEACRERGVELIFLYVPSYGDPPVDEAQRAYLESRGRLVHFDDLDELYRGPLWRDPDHLNTEGARVLTAHYIRALEPL